MFGLARPPGEPDAHSNMRTTSLNNFLPPTEAHSPESAHSSLSSNLDIHDNFEFIRYTSVSRKLFIEYFLDFKAHKLLDLTEPQSQ